MKLSDPTWLASKSRVGGTALKAILVVGLFALGHTAVAQDVLAPPPPSPPVTPTALQEVQTEDQEIIQPVEGPPLISPEAEKEPLRWGPLTLQPHLFYRFLDGNGIQSSPGKPVNTIINQISPGLFLNIGTHWSLDYTPTWTLYTSKELRDSLDHAATIAGGGIYENWTLGASQSYVSSSAPIVQTGKQTRQADYLTTLTASYQFNPQMKLDLDAEQSFQFAEKLAETHEWSTLDWLNYQFWPAFTAGAGFGGGYIDVLGGVNSAYEQGQARIQWKPTKKVSVEVHGGVEDLQFVDVNTPDLVNPVFGVVAEYRPTEVTTLSVNADRTVNPTVFEDQLSENTRVEGSVNQRFLKKLYLTVDGEYEEIKYISAKSSVPGGREDDYFALGVRLSGTVLKRIKVAALYQRSENTSNQSGFAFTSNQFGVELSCRY
jgi:putative beta-barrel porin BBP2